MSFALVTANDSKSRTANADEIQRVEAGARSKDLSRFCPCNWLAFVARGRDGNDNGPSIETQADVFFTVWLTEDSRRWESKIEEGFQQCLLESLAGCGIQRTDELLRQVHLLGASEVAGLSTGESRGGFSFYCGLE